MIATFLLEGFLLTLRRPDAVLNRLIYTVIANIIIGIVLSLYSARYMKETSNVSNEDFGFRNIKNTIITVLIGVGTGFVFYLFQNPPSLNPIVILNAYAQVLLVSIAEILVCWMLVGNIAEKLLENRGKWISKILPFVISSAFFGIYHFAHSPPFNTTQMVLFLTLIGMITSIFYYIVKNIYATIVFHNFMGITGVLTALEAAGTLEIYRVIQFPLFITAGIGIAILLTFDFLWIRKTHTNEA